MLENEDIYNLVETQGTSAMSDFQTRYFVVNSQVTDYRRVKQALLEIETRIAAKKQMERNMKRTEIQKQMKLREMAFENDNLTKELIQLDIDQLDYDMSVYEKKHKVCIEELNLFSQVVKEIVPDANSLEAYTGNNEEEEKKYWITRMAKQAAMDLIATGRIGQGNLDSIAMMPISDQQETIKAALKYNGVLNKGISVLERQALEELAALPSEINYIEHIVNHSLSLEDKTQGEDI